MKRATLFAIIVTLIATSAVDSFAQYSRRSSRGYGPSYRMEITPFGGYGGTFSRRVNFPLATGDLDVRSSEFWGVNIAFNVRPDGQAFLLYQRQDSDLTFNSLVTGRVSTPLALEYWHVGGAGGITRGDVFTFTSLSLGATRILYKDFNADNWNFSVIFGLGAKIYSEGRIGFLVQGRLPWVLTDGGAGLGIGAGGGYVYAGGTGFAQIDISGGLIIRL